jgi:putative aminopeptidase FrvX
MLDFNQRSIALNQTRLRRLERLLEIPTAPFREQAVIDHVLQWCRRSGIPCFSDPIGNLVVGARDRAQVRKLVSARSAEPLRVFVAHMDHPGLHGQSWLGGNRLAAQWHGGSPVRHLRGAPLWLADASGYVGSAKITSAKIHKAGYAMTDIRLRVDDPDLRDLDPKQLFGGFAFRRPVWRSGARIYTKAADDLVGVFAILETARDLVRRRSRAPFLGLLTRGEEVGFVGAVEHFELGWLTKSARRPVVCVSLETSRTFPGAIIGKGPVVRLGDRRTVFDPAGLSVLDGIAAKLLPGRHQRRIMDGGSCEATAATAWGLPAIGISVPLGNYHNQGYEGGPDCRGVEGPAPELVHEKDVDGLLTLCGGLMQPRLPWADAWADTRKRLAKNAKSYRRLLDL